MLGSPVRLQKTYSYEERKIIYSSLKNRLDLDSIHKFSKNAEKKVIDKDVFKHSSVVLKDPYSN
jgi:hypothetical protein